MSGSTLEQVWNEAANRVAHRVVWREGGTDREETRWLHGLLYGRRYALL
jgi:hypothetical protein